MLEADDLPATWGSILRRIYPGPDHESDDTLWKAVARERKRDAVNTFRTSDALRVLKALWARIERAESKDA